LSGRFVSIVGHGTERLPWRQRCTAVRQPSIPHRGEARRTALGAIRPMSSCRADERNATVSRMHRVRGPLLTPLFFVLATGCRPTQVSPPPRPAPPPPTTGPGAAPDPVYVQVASHAEHTCVLRRQGDVLCWGKNTYGQLGDGRRDDSAQPKAV